MTIQWKLAASLATCVAIGVLGCGEGSSPAAPPRLVILYATCSLNKDFLSPYREEIRFTPSFERFAREAIVFDRHQTESGQSGTAYASLFSGVHADEHGVYDHPTRLPEELTLITEAFARAGYAVHSFLAHTMAGANLGYAQGAEVHAGALRVDRPDALAILDGLRADPAARALLVTNFTLTHGPYQGLGLASLCAQHPERCGAMQEPWYAALRDAYREFGIALSFDYEATVERLGLTDRDIERLVPLVELLYEAGVVALDERFGRLLDALEAYGLADDSLIVFTADHGELLYRDDTFFHWTHGFQLAPEVLNVPLMIRAPGLAAGRYEAVTRSIDVFPTLAGLARVPLGDAKVRGVDLSGVLRGDQAPPELQAFSHTALFPPSFWYRYGSRPAIREVFPSRGAEWMRVGMRDGDRFFELAPSVGGGVERAVFDLSRDPAKTSNLFDANDPEHAVAGERLRDYRTRLVDAHARRRRAVAPVPEQQRVEALRELGYIE